MDLVRRAHAPQKEREWDDDRTCRKQPQPVLGLHDAVVAARERQRQPVGQPAREHEPQRDADQARHVRRADDAGGEVVGGGGEDDGRRRVQHVEPDQRAAVGEAGVEHVGPEHEGQLLLDAVVHELRPRLVFEGQFLPEGLLRLCEFTGRIIRLGGGRIGGRLDQVDILLRICQVSLTSTRRRPPALDHADGLAVVVRLLHEEEHEDEPDGAEDGGPVKHPPVALPVVDPAAHDRREVVAPDERERVQRQVGPSLVRKVDVGDGELGQGLDGRGEEAAQDALGDPLPVAFGVRGPDRHAEDAERREQVGGPLAVLQRKGLPEQKAVAGEEEEVARAGVQVADADVEGEGEGDEDGVDDAVGDPVDERVHNPARGAEGFAAWRPVERVVRVVARGRDEDDVLVAFALGVLGVQGVLEVDEVDGTRDDGVVDLGQVQFSSSSHDLGMVISNI